MKVYLNEEVGRLKSALKSAKSKTSIATDVTLKDKIEEVYNILDNTKNREIDTETLEIVLSTQQLLEEIEDDGNT